MAHDVNPPRQWVLFIRTWLPRIVGIVAVPLLAAMWLWPGLDGGIRVGITMFVIQLTILLMGIWIFGFSGYPWLRRFGSFFIPLGLLFAVGWALVQEVHFKGDMTPYFIWRWQPSQADREAQLEEHRRGQGSVATQGPIEAIADNPLDFPEYRGRQRDGVITGPPLARDWKTHPPRLLWRQPIGGGYAGFAVAGNTAVTIEQRRDQEAVACYDVQTGKERWVYPYPASFKEFMGGPGPRATPTLAGGNVYSLGATGRLVCLDLKTGQEKWQANILENNDNLPWGMSGSPLVYDQVVVVTPGVQRESAAGRGVLAYDRATGYPVWSAGKAKGAYSSPMLATLAGERQLLVLDAGGLKGYHPSTGKELWHYDWVTYQDINVAQPVVLEGDRIFISSGYDHGSDLLQVSKVNGQWAEPQSLWPNHSPNPALRCKFSNPVLYQGHLYGLDERNRVKLVCVEVETGKQKWSGGEYGHGQLLLAGDLLVILAETGKLALVEANPEQFRELSSFRALQGEKTWNYPALAGGKIFLRNHEEMACYDLAP
jgi:outer membrane protein assembly factor BamB